MNGKDLLLSLQHTRDEFIEEAEFGSFAVPFRAGKRVRRVLVAAAAIGLGLLLMGCAIAYFLRVQDLRLGTEDTRQVLTVSGLTGTDNYRAAKEWYDFTRSFDPDYQLRRTIDEQDAHSAFGRAYEAYHPYAPEMCSKLDELAAKYNLKLLGEHTRYRFGGSFFRSLGLDGILVPGTDAVMTFQNGGRYDGGNFAVVFTLDLPGADWPEWMMGHFRYCRKDCLATDEFILNTDTAFTEWNYTTAAGSRVLLVQMPEEYGAYLFCDRDDATIMVSLSTLVKPDNESSRAITPRQLEQIADALDFRIRPVPSDEPAAPAGWKITPVSAQNGRVTMTLSAPEGTVLLPERTDLCPGSWGCTCNRDIVIHYTDLRLEDDEDGKDNTCRLTLEISVCSGMDEAAFAPDAAWTLQILDLYRIPWTEGAAEEELQQGNWVIPFSFS